VSNGSGGGPQQRAPGRHRRAEVVAGHRGDLAVAQRHHQPQRIAHQVQHAIAGEVTVVALVPAGAAAVAALVGGDRVEAGGGQRRHQLAPAVGQLGEAVQQQHDRAAGCRMAGFQQVHAQAVDAVDEAAAHAGRQQRRIEGRKRFRDHRGRSPGWQIVDRHRACDRMSSSAGPTPCR